MATNDNTQDIFGPIISADNLNSSPAQSDDGRVSNNLWELVSDGTGKISSSRWNQYWPYKFVVVKKDADSGNYTLNSDWSFTLPIPPESLSIQTPFAINTNVTLGGIIEEHNAAPIRMISLSGSFGVFPMKGTADIKPPFNSGQAIAGGTLNSINKISNAFSSLIQNTSIQNVFEVSSSIDSDSPIVKSGYVMFRKLQLFFEKYINFKKNGDFESKQSFLAFKNDKDESVYLVTPISFNYKRTADSPYEYLYDIQLKAFSRIKIDSKAKNVKLYTSVTRDPSSFSKLLVSVEAGREVLEGARGLLQAASADIENVLFTPLRELTLYAKAGLGVVEAMADFSPNLLKDTKNAVANFLVNHKQVVLEAAKLDKRFAEIEKSANSFSEVATIMPIGETQNSGIDSGIGKSISANSNTSSSTSANGNFNPNAKPAFKDINFDATKLFPLLKNIKPTDLKLSPEVKRRMAAERDKVSKKTRLEFERERDKIRQFMTDYANLVGAGSATFDNMFGGAGNNVDATPTDSDFQILFNLNQVLIEFNRLCVSESTTQFSFNKLDFIAGLASQSGIAFTKPTSKFLIPFPYGSTLENLAANYLGDPNRWFEIATLNGLQAPYIDEEGFTLPLLVNGNGNEIAISSIDNIYVNQPVFIVSLNSTKNQRSIVKIKKLSANQYVLTLDGPADLDKYTVLANAYLHAFLPNIVNSQMTIYMPSDAQPTQSDHKFKAIPGLKDFDNLIAEGGVDLLLTPTNDLAVTDNGDCKLAVGLTNIIQDARLKLSVIKGTLLQHPGFGLPIKIGETLADLNINDIPPAVKDLFAGDDAFTGVNNIIVNLKGPALTIGMNLGVKSIKKFLPVVFNLT